MAHRVTWSPRAVEDLEAIARYIAVDSSAYAAAVVKTVLATTRKVSKFPFAGRVVPEFKDENTREWFAYSYRIIYRIENNVVTIATIVHAKRLLTEEGPECYASGRSVAQVALKQQLQPKLNVPWVAGGGDSAEGRRTQEVVREVEVRVVE
jgi:toxin ParE1/3/4